MPRPAPEEASASARATARSLRDLHVALVAEQFTDDQALRIIGTVLAAAMHANNRRDDRP